MLWKQTTIQLHHRPRGVHPISTEVLGQLPDLAALRVGMLNLFLQHTSASLTINENADPDVPADLETTLCTLVPESLPYRHTCEGPDDMPAHVKTTLIGPSLTIPIQNGRLLLGTWQGIFLCEHRKHAGPRRVVATLWGEPKDG